MFGKINWRCHSNILDFNCFSQFSKTRRADHSKNVEKKFKSIDISAKSVNAVVTWLQTLGRKWNADSTSNVT